MVCVVVGKGGAKRGEGTESLWEGGGGQKKSIRQSRGSEREEGLHPPWPNSAMRIVKKKKNLSIIQTKLFTVRQTAMRRGKDKRILNRVFLL